MFSGKTDEMVRLLRRAEIAGRRVLLIRPTLDDRTTAEEVRSRSGATFRSRLIKEASEIPTLVRMSGADIIAIEEAQFLGPEIVAVVEELANAGRQIVLTGLDLDFLARPFGPMPQLLAVADEVNKLTAICTVCGDEATRSQRLVGDRPAGADDPLVVIGGLDDDRYEARCRTHHQLG
jgi:thymidine kinase